MYKRIISMAAIVTLIFGMFTFQSGTNTQAAGGFPDVESQNPFRQAIEYLKDNNVIKGYPSGLYQPKRTVNRAELLKILIEGSGYDVPEPTEDCFPDVLKGEWFAKYVCFAKAKGWIEGYPDGNFRPGQTVNKVEALKILAMVQGWSFEDEGEENFKDVDYRAWYAVYLRYAESKGLLPESDQGNTFDPNGGMTRETIAENVFRAIAIMQLKRSRFQASMGDEIVAEKLKLAPIGQRVGVVINEFNTDNTGLGQWIELYNASESKVEVRGWDMVNKNAEVWGELPDFTFPPGEFLLIYRGRGTNDLSFNDASGGKIYVETTKTILSHDNDAVGLVSDAAVTPDTIVDYVRYCRDGECDDGSMTAMAIEAGQWPKDGEVFHIDIKRETQNLGRDKHGTDTNSPADWYIDGGFHSGIATPGKVNETEKYSDVFDGVGTELPTDDESANMSTELASFGTVSSDLVAVDECDYLALLKQAIEMMKMSCYETDLIDEMFDDGGRNELNTDNLTSSGIRERFMGQSRRDVTSVTLSPEIEVRFGRGPSNKRGEAHVPVDGDGNQNIGGNTVIEINTRSIDCNAENLKAVLFHELIHEHQLRRRNYGIWDASGNRTTPPTTNRGHGSNNVDPAIMVADCMEVEAHMRTAECIQKEQRMEEFDAYGDEMDELLGDSKSYADRFLYNGVSGNRHRNGCFTYIQQIKNNTDRRGRTIRNADWLAENAQIWGYLQNWETLLQNMRVLFYEKFFASIGSERTRLRRFRTFITQHLGLPADKVAETIADWERIEPTLGENRVDQRKAYEEAEKQKKKEDKTTSTSKPKVDQRPRAVITPSNATCKAGETMSLSANSSSDDNEIVAFEWDLGNDQEFAGRNMEFICPDPLSRTIAELLIRDNAGQIGVAHAAITSRSDEDPQPPVAQIQPRVLSCEPGEELTITDGTTPVNDVPLVRREWYSNGEFLGDKNALIFDCPELIDWVPVELRVFDQNDLVSIETIPIEIVALDLESVDPIDVTPPPTDPLPPPTTGTFKIDGISLQQQHDTFEQTPHIFILDVNMSGVPEGITPSCSWSSDCGYFDGSTSGLSVDWRYDNWECGNATIDVDCTIFADGFESGDTTSWQPFVP